MASGWDAFDNFIDKLDDFWREYAMADFSLHMKTKSTYFVASTTLSVMMEGLVLRGRLDAAREYAVLTDKYARAAIEREHIKLGSGVKHTPDMMKSSMWKVIYFCRWFLDGQEDERYLKRVLKHAKAAVKEDANKKRSSYRDLNKFSLASLAMKLGDFGLARDYFPKNTEPIDWSHPVENNSSWRLSCSIVNYLFNPKSPDEERYAIENAFTDLFTRLRDGIMDPRGDIDWSCAIALAYYGLKHFEALREGAPFTYEEVVRSIRYKPGTTT